MKRKLVNDLTGKTFGRLYVLGIDDDKPSKKIYFVCQCACGNVKSVRSDSLICGAVKSCGCLKKEQDKINLSMSENKKRYADLDFAVSGTRLYGIWQGIKKRCYISNDPRYHRYGGRGITVCKEWKESFTAFYKWAIDNGYDEEKTIDRIDNNGNYEPNNCRWANIKEQCNNRETNINITIGNSTKTLAEWCEIFNLDFKTILARYHRSEIITLDELFRTIPRQSADR